MACLIRQEARVSTNSRLRCQIEASMSRPSQTKSAYVQTVTDGKCQCPGFRSFTRLSYFYVQIFVRSPDFRAFMSRLSCVHQTSCVLVQTLCVHQTFMRSCPDFRAFIRLRVFLSRFSCVHQTFLRSCSGFRAFSRLSGIRKTSCVDVRFFVHSADFRAFMSRLSSVHVQILLISRDLSAFKS